MGERVFALKWFDENGRSPQQGYAWPLPKGKRPGKWVAATGELEVCRNGIHAVGFDGAVEWVNARCFVIELGGEVIYSEEEKKYVARQGRLVREVELDVATFARRCAYRARHHAVGALRSVGLDEQAEVLAKARGLSKMEDAAWAAAWAAARDAAGAAAGDAAWAAAWAAWAAARDAAGAAAGDAAGAAAWAAWAAARDAAGAAAGDAARDAAGAAAWDAAWDAEIEWQAKELRKLIDAPEVER